MLVLIDFAVGTIVAALVWANTGNLVTTLMYAILAILLSHMLRMWAYDIFSSSSFGNDYLYRRLMKRH